MSKNVLYVALACMLVACGNKQMQQAEQASGISDETLSPIVESVEEPSAPEPLENIRIIMQSIIEGDAEKLATVTAFPIYQAYPLKDISNADDLKRSFDILFDDSIKNVLRKATIDDWSYVGWHGWMMYDGNYLWTTEDGLLRLVTYESKARNDYVQKMRAAEQQDLNESKDWYTHSCFLAQDSSTFLRLETMDGVQRLHVFTHEEEPHWQHLVFNGTLSWEGTCNNEDYWYAYEGKLINLWAESPSCSEWEMPYGVEFPDHNYLPPSIRGKTIPLQRAFWRDVKKWWK